MNQSLNIITKSAQTIKSLDHHPLKPASLEHKILYLNVLSLLYDENILSSNYLAILLNAVDVDLSMKQDFLDFSKNSDEETIVSFLQALRGSNLVLPFLSDCLMLCGCEDDLKNNNIQVINKLAVELGVYGEKRTDLYKNFSLLKESYLDDVKNNVIAGHIVNYFKFNLSIFEIESKRSSTVKITSELKDENFIMCESSDIIIEKGLSGRVIWNKRNNVRFKKGDIIASIGNGNSNVQIIAPMSGILNRLAKNGEFCSGSEKVIIGKYLHAV